MQSCESLRLFDSGAYIFDVSQLSDAKLRTDDGCTFDIHRIILVEYSDYFADLFCGVDRDKREFTIPGMSGECLSNILYSAYDGYLDVTESNVKDLITAAGNRLLNKNFLKEIKRDIKTHITEINCFEILKAAHQIDEDIFRECFRFVQTRFEELVRRQTDKLADLPLEIFRSILSDRSLYVYDETTVWQAIVEWTQKDIPSRMCCVPQLLLTLATEDTGEELATEILRHEIISKNPSMEDLRPSNDSTSNLDVFLSFVRSYSNPFPQPCSHRIPSSLYVILSPIIRLEDLGSFEMYVTYDENLDLWRKITKARLLDPYGVVAKGRNIYILDVVHCRNFDFSAMEWVPMEDMGHLYHNFCVATIDAYIYVLGENLHDGVYGLQAYDTMNDRWSDVALPFDLCYGAIVAIEKKIYLVGNSRSFDGMMMQVFDPVKRQWSLLPPPTLCRSRFALVAYREKIYLVGGKMRDEEVYFSSTEAFDLATNLWKELPNMPYINYVEIKGMVFNDQIVVYDAHYKQPDKCVRWNDAMKCWKSSTKLTPSTICATTSFVPSTMSIPYG